VIPTQVNYGAMAEERQSLLKNALDSARPADARKGMSFAYLNLSRLVAPQRAVPAVLQAIQKDPQNQALHNLLGLSYLESGNLPAARVTFLSLVARGVKNAAVWNNLGIMANLDGNEVEAIEYFQQAAQMEAPREALVNLGFIALKYRNGFEAKKQFEKALELAKDDAAAQVGMATALLQNREMESAKDSLVEAAKKYHHDPYARLSLGYFLMDVEKENEAARKILTEDHEGQPEDLVYRHAIQETNHTAPAHEGGLPTIE
jgi:Flp pilus assembly protein TadD